jgi:hypothetical protein
MDAVPAGVLIMPSWICMPTVGPHLATTPKTIDGLLLRSHDEKAARSGKKPENFCLGPRLLEHSERPSGLQQRRI